MEAWPNKQFLKVRVETIHSSRITFLDTEYRNRIYLWEKPGRTKDAVSLERGKLVTLLASVVEQESQGNKQYCTLKRVKVLS